MTKPEDYDPKYREEQREEIKVGWERSAGLGIKLHRAERRIEELERERDLASRYADWDDYEARGRRIEELEAAATAALCDRNGTYCFTHLGHHQPVRVDDALRQALNPSTKEEK